MVLPRHSVLNPPAIGLAMTSLLGRAAAVAGALALTLMLCRPAEADAVRVEWSPVTGAAAYRVDRADDRAPFLEVDRVASPGACT